MNFDFLSRYDVLGAFWLNVQLTFWSAIGSFVLGLILAAMRVSPVTVLRGFATTYVNVVRNIPLTVIIIMMSQVLYYQMKISLVWGNEGGIVTQEILDLENFRLAILGFILYTSTFVCEAIRSGINTVPPGQAEAARAIGLKFTQVLGIIVLPQAVRAVVAPLASVLIALTKNTTVAAAIGVSEAALLMNKLMENEADAFMAIFLVIALGFVILTLPVGLFLGWVAKKATVRR